MNYYIIGKRIKIMMEIKEVKRSYLAKKMHISYNTLTKKLNGAREISLNEADIIIKELDIPLDLAANILFNREFDFEKFLINSDLIIKEK